MKTINKKTVEKTALFLKDLHDSIKDGKDIRINQYIHKHHLTTRVSQSIQKLGIINNISRGRGQKKSICWNVGEPSLKMAEQVVKGCQVIKRNEIAKTDQKVINFESESISKLDVQRMIQSEIQKAINKPKTKRVLKFRNPFYWLTVTK